LTYYIHTKVSLKLGRLPAYHEMMAKLSPYMRRHGWKLVMALEPFISEFTELVHIWEVDEFGDIEKGLRACRTDPEAHALLAPMPELLHDEALKIMVKTPYSG